MTYVACSRHGHSVCAAACSAAAASCAHGASILLRLPDTMCLVSGFLLRMLIGPDRPRQGKKALC